MAGKSQTFWVVLLAAGCAAVLSGSPWGCASDGDRQAHLSRGMAHGMTGEYDAAIEDYTKVMKSKYRTSVP